MYRLNWVTREVAELGESTHPVAWPLWCVGMNVYLLICLIPTMLAVRWCIDVRPTEIPELLQPFLTSEGLHRGLGYVLIPLGLIFPVRFIYRTSRDYYRRG